MTFLWKSQSHTLIHTQNVNGIEEERTSEVKQTTNSPCTKMITNVYTISNTTIILFVLLYINLSFALCFFGHDKRFYTCIHTHTHIYVWIIDLLCISNFETFSGVQRLRHKNSHATAEITEQQHTSLLPNELKSTFDSYFKLFPWHLNVLALCACS